MPCNLSNLLFSSVQTIVPSCLSIIDFDCFVGCWLTSYVFVGRLSRSGLMVVVKKGVWGDLHPPNV
jgi:hypothetical protein